MRHGTDSPSESTFILTFRNISANYITCTKSQNWTQRAMFLRIAKLVCLTSLPTTKTCCSDLENLGCNKFDGIDRTNASRINLMSFWQFKSNPIELCLTTSPDAHRQSKRLQTIEQFPPIWVNWCRILIMDFWLVLKRGLTHLAYLGGSPLYLYFLCVDCTCGKPSKD